MFQPSLVATFTDHRCILIDIHSIAALAQSFVKHRYWRSVKMAVNNSWNIMRDSLLADNSNLFVIKLFRCIKCTEGVHYQVWCNSDIECPWTNPLTFPLHPYLPRRVSLWGDKYKGESTIFVIIVTNSPLLVSTQTSCCFFLSYFIDVCGTCREFILPLASVRRDIDLRIVSVGQGPTFSF